VLTPGQAVKKVGQRVTVELTVRSVGLNTSGNLYFLNSEENYRHGDNFTVVIPGTLLDNKEAGIAALREAYAGRRVQVVGMVSLYHSQPQIAIEKLEQLRLVTENPDRP
jgi:hypothetical protein